MEMSVHRKYTALNLTAPAQETITAGGLNWQWFIDGSSSSLYHFTKLICCFQCKIANEVYIWYQDIFCAFIKT